MRLPRPLAAALGPRSFPHGIHPASHKETTAHSPIRLLVPRRRLAVPLGTAGRTVAARQEVRRGDLIAEGAGSAVHASVDGRAAPSLVSALPGGGRSPVVPIDPSPLEPDAAEALRATLLGSDWRRAEPDRHDPEAIADAVRAAGIVGLGGAGFPTHRKLRRDPARPVDTLILNGCECEPYLTADHRLMVEVPDGIAVGMQLAARAVGASRAIVAIESNKPDAIAAMRRAVADRPGVSVEVCATRYPMGAERQLTYALLGRVVPSAPAGFPLDVGVLVVNVATAHAVAQAVVHGRPQTHRVVTVTGGGVARPGNWLVPIGAQLAELIDAAGGLVEGALEVLAGGPMMGAAVPRLDVPLTATTGGVTALLERETVRWHESPCIRCGRCLAVCPLFLTPTRIAHAVRARDFDLAERFHVEACCECGCCSAVCPAEIPLAQSIRAGKREWRRRRSEERPAAGAGS